MDMKPRKRMTIGKVCHKGIIARRLYLKREDDSEALISVKSCTDQSGGRWTMNNYIKIVKKD